MLQQGMGRIRFLYVGKFNRIQVLLTKMGIKPFEYGMKVVSVYDNGAVTESARACRYY